MKEIKYFILCFLMSFTLIIIYQRFNIYVHGIPVGGNSWNQILKNMPFIVLWSLFGAFLYYYGLKVLRRNKIADTIEAKKRILDREKYHSLPNTHECRVCGCYSDDFPWGEDGRSPSYGICACCGVQFGKEDISLNSIKTYRSDWVHKGGNWYKITKKPEHWNIDEQMKHIPDEFK